MSDAPPLILVDGSSYLYRAFHALPPLATSKGQPIGAVRGVVAMLRKLRDQYPASNIVVVFDAKGKTFRDDMYPEYKSQRPPMPDEMREQIEPLHDCVRALGFPMIIHAGVEADDVMGTLAVYAAKQGIKSIISTGDKDMAQLVSEHITLVNTMSDSTYDRQGVIDKFGVPPELIIDYLAIIGDSSDNIPGVPGVGPKSATPMLNALGGLKEIYSNLEAIRDLDFRGAKKMPEKLEEHRDQAFMSYDLATIKTDVEMDEKLEDLVNDEPDKARLKELYTELEFKSWLKELDKSAGEGDQEPEKDLTNVRKAQIEQNYACVLEKAEFEHWLEKLKTAEIFAFDTETTSLNYMDAEIVGVSFAVDAGEAAYVPVAHDYMDAPQQLDRDWVLEQLKPLLEDKGKVIVAQNLKYDQSVLANYGIEVRCQPMDTMLESYVLNSVAGRHDMDSLALRHLDRETIHFEDIAGKGAKQLTFNQIALEQAAPYAAEDADITLQLHQELWPQLEKIAPLKKLYLDIEAPLVSVLSHIERNGALIDPDAMFAQSEEIAAKVQNLETQVHDLAGQVFNLGSPKQLQEILYEKQELPVLKKTPKGQPSTAEEVLQQLADDYEIPRLILEYRSLSKLKSTYTDKLPLMISKKTGRVHTSYHQAVAATGRLSSSDPNLQNIPVRTEEGRRIRKAFIAPEGKKLVAADYSQIELRIMAHLSHDKGLMKAFKQGKDVHSATASEVFDVSLDDVTSEHRRKAKAINFGLIYGMSAFGLGRQLQVGRNEAQKYIDLYFDRYPGVKQFMDRIRAQAAEDGYVETLFGRRLYLPEINDRNGQRRQAAERTAINAPMQGTAADIIKFAMIDVHQWLQQSDFDVRMIMQVHDELVFEVPEDQLDAFIPEIEKRMESAAELDVPLLVEAGVGSNWEEAH
jgi:DNA polymerase-1